MDELIANDDFAHNVDECLSKLPKDLDKCAALAPESTCTIGMLTQAGLCRIAMRTSHGELMLIPAMQGVQQLCHAPCQGGWRSHPVSLLCDAINP